MQVIPDPKFITILADQDGFARWLVRLDTADIMAAYRQGGIHLLVTMYPEGELEVATKPGNEWNCTWTPPVQVERA